MNDHELYTSVRKFAEGDSDDPSGDYAELRRKVLEGVARADGPTLERIAALIAGGDDDGDRSEPLDGNENRVLDTFCNSFAEDLKVLGGANDLRDGFAKLSPENRREMLGQYLAEIRRR